MRELILSEIKRVAAESGKAPGRRTFERCTGISEGKWSGVYWARWGDALEEAGFSANTLNTRFESDFVFQKLAEACKHAGKLPTQIELKLYRKNIDPEFPDEKTFRKRFPKKEELIEAFRTWVASNPAMIDLANLLPEKRTKPSNPPVIQSRQSYGYVYLIRSGDYVKIGRSDEIERRFKEIKVALPDKATLLHVIETDDPAGIEAYWHRRFAERRANGEWFKLLPSDIAAFCKRKFQ